MLMAKQLLQLSVAGLLIEQRFFIVPLLFPLDMCRNLSPVDESADDELSPAILRRTSPTGLLGRGFWEACGQRIADLLSRCDSSLLNAEEIGT